MAAPILRLTKAEIDWLYKNKCKHRHNYLEHYGCYIQEQGASERIGFFDIEASNLKADFGIMFSYCIKPQGKPRILYSVITKRDLDAEEANQADKRVIKQCVDDLRKFDRIVTHYGTKFDIPFIRTRALVCGVEFPEYKELCHTDTYYMARRLLCLSSNRQGNVAEVLQGKNIKTRIDSRHWIKALQGDAIALDYILDHNKKDVRQLEKNYERLVNFTKGTSKSL